MPGVRKFTYKKKPKKVKKTNQLSLLEAIDQTVRYEDLTPQEKSILSLPFDQWVAEGPSIFDWSENLRKYSNIIFK